MNLKTSFVLLVIFSIYFNLKSQNISSYPLHLEFNTIAVSRCNDYNDYYLEHDKSYSNIYGEFSLSNPTDSAFTFWIMKCSWTDLVKIEPDSILLIVKECDGNYPVKISLECGQSIVFNSIVEVPTEHFNKSVKSKYEDREYSSFRIGFMIIAENEYTRQPYQDWRKLVKDKMENSRFIWTSPIDIEYSVYDWRIKN